MHTNNTVARSLRFTAALKPLNALLQAFAEEARTSLLPTRTRCAATRP
jgi:hypothetical protein